MLFSFYKHHTRIMGKVSLIIMAAGLGSRFGLSIKQLEPVGPSGETIMDYSIYDALEAGFNKIVFVIRKDIEEEFKRVVGNRVAARTEVHYVYQELHDIPLQYQEQFEERTKPWGTGQAVLCCKDVVKEPFLIINADDYYGKKAYIMAYDFLVKRQPESNSMLMCMVGFVLKNTLSDNGSVTRGICTVSSDGILEQINETHNIDKRGNGIVAISDIGEQIISEDSIVSMNMWGAPAEFITTLSLRFDDFLDKLSNSGDQNYLESEFLLPVIIGDMLENGEAEVKVLPSLDKWFGVTYKEDGNTASKAIGELVKNKVYSAKLFEMKEN